MKGIRAFFKVILALLLLTGQQAMADAFATGPHIEVQLISETRQLTPGHTHWFGVYMQPEEQWHTYWQNPGDSGEAPSIEWRLPEGFTTGDIHWPQPQAIPVAHLTNYGYEADNLLMVPIEVPDTYSGESATITADVYWLVCKEDCIPGDAVLSLTLPITEQASPGDDAVLFTQARALLPEVERLSGRHELTEEHLVLSFEGPTQNEWHVFPFRDDVIVHSAEQQWLRNDNNITVTVPLSAYFDRQAGELAFLVSDGTTGYYLDSQLNLAESQPAQRLGWYALLTFIAMAFAGGVILNLMPCVLPILALKALSLKPSQQQRQHAWAYFAGVLVSFNIFTLIILSLKSGGEAVGWGFHMQQPIVLVVLAFLFTLIALMLWDVLPAKGRLAGLGERLTEGDSASSHFFTGVLAVVVASPCTAPFMAAALGVAMVSPAMETIVLFNALAIGFAMPLTLVGLSPRLSKLLPKPGAWMQSFKHFLAFPMLGTVVWLAWVLANQSGTQAQAALLAGLVMFALCIWLAGRAFKGAYPVGLTAAALCVLLVGIGLSGQHDEAVADTLSFSTQVLEEKRSQNRVVLVNMTADWCITCKVNEQVALSSESVANALQQQDVDYVVGDWTNKNDRILEYLNQYDRAGVPLYVVYGGTEHVEVLPQILTPDIVVQAINRARKEIENVK